MQQSPQDSENAILAKYKSAMESMFSAKVDDVDFQSQAGQIKNTVNDWVKEKTHGLIQQIMDNPPSPSTALLLLNAIYFKGSWDQKFDPKANVKLPFFHKDWMEEKTLNSCSRRCA